VAMAWAIVVVAFLYKFAIRVSPHFGFDVDWLNISLPTRIEMKVNLSALRLIHFLSVALLVARYIGPTSTLLRWPVFTPVIQIGARSLEIYSLTIVLTVLARIIVTVYHPSLPSKILMDSVLFVLMTLTVTILPRPKVPPKTPMARGP